MKKNTKTIQRGKHTYEEILSQPAVWNSAISVVKNSRPALENIDLSQFDQVIFTGCGSTYYLSLSAAVIFQETAGMLARAVPASELLFSPSSVHTFGKSLLVAISRSGSTTETIAAVEQFHRQNRGYVIGITNYQNEALAGLANLALVIEKGQEKSVAQTRSFASMLVAATAMTAILAHKRDWVDLLYQLPAIGTRIMSEYQEVSRSIGENLNLDRFYFLGSGSRYGLACETNLKMKEMTLTHSEPFHFFEFRHGPMAMVTPSTQIIGLTSISNRKNESKVLNEMASLGAQTISLGEANADLNFSSGLPEALQNVLFLPFLQLTAYHRSIQKDLDPDNPTNLTSVVKLEIQ